MTDDTALIDRAGRGEDRAFRELYERHVDGLYRFLRQYSDDPMLVEDWVQRSFIKAFRSIGSFRQEARFATWLLGIGINEMRSDRRRPTVVSFDSEEVALWNGQEDGRDGDFLREESVRRLIGRLDDAKRTVFLLHAVEGYSHAEIAAMLGITEGTSRAQLSRAKQWLRDALRTEETTT